MDDLIIKSTISIADQSYLSTNKGKTYSKYSVEHAINEFNKICPIKGGLLNRKHIQTIGTYTHITRELFITDCLSACVTIIDSKYKDELLEHEDKLIIRPIISTPLSFNNSGVEHVIRIINVQLELEL